MSSVLRHPKSPLNHTDVTTATTEDIIDITIPTTEVTYKDTSDVTSTTTEVTTEDTNNVTTQPTAPPPPSGRILQQSDINL